MYEMNKSVISLAEVGWPHFELAFDVGKITPAPYVLSPKAGDRASPYLPLGNSSHVSARCASAKRADDLCALPFISGWAVEVWTPLGKKSNSCNIKRTDFSKFKVEK
jgi:hypothetical protein